MSKKNPFVSYTPEEIFASEAGNYIVIAGTDIFKSTDGSFIFDKKKAAKYYNQILEELSYQSVHGKTKQRKDAMILLSTLRIEPFRMH